MNGIDKAYAAIEAEKLRHHIPDAENMVPSNHPESPDSSKPSWADAPEWANWLAQCEEGMWLWFEDVPWTDSGDWWPKDNKSRWQGWPFSPLDIVPNWKETLEERPR